MSPNESGPARLDAHVVVRRPGHTVDVRLTAEPGDVIAVIGPNGAGKSTLVRALAGIVPLSEGHVRVDGQLWEGERGRRLEARHRRVGMVFQSDLLFPHLTALGNAAFGPRSRGVGRRTAEATAQSWLDRLGIGDLARRRPHQLSGGQAQRVSIARALAGEPGLLLLDEPLSALDVGVAMALRIELARHLADFPGVAVLVTHDALDAMTLANRVLVLEDGAVAQEGSPTEVATAPRTDHVARLVGLNVLRGLSEGTLVRLDDGSVLVTTTPAHGPVSACFSPAAVTLTPEQPAGSARNRWRAPIASVAPHGEAVRVHLEGPVGLIADVTPASATGLGLVPGREVWASVKATEVRVYTAI
ncbi:ABC transporter ATP-binding protein [Nocardioides mesophilus]|uniref:ABC transporter ATP-binding protein n=1 Tax=Nocardioides mesophilus TaxID=433659 RepID=A0A7G9R7U8_9ACTN|nr:ABC transporter ATP-binding protein [Nocardioides mesophilus]QNN51673.1 ABC transporter ATP-binding protein [Nocardioides mesophilus]